MVNCTSNAYRGLFKSFVFLWAPLLWLLILPIGLVSCSTPEAGKTDDAPLCEPSRCSGTCCGDVCIQTTVDKAHCGACNNPCDEGESCVNSMCTLVCKASERICQGKCTDINANINHCGGCGRECAANMQCVRGECYCQEGYVNCDGNIKTGCEKLAQNCSCSPGQTESCYDFDPKTLNVGACKAGTRECSSKGYFGRCEGQVGPGPEIYGNGIDDNCNGLVDEPEDLDGDGWTTAEGDCCDNFFLCNVENPAAVNPGAYDFLGNGVDDDCDGTVDNEPNRNCSKDTMVLAPRTKLNSNHAKQLLQAMEICKESTGKDWGIISAELTLANGDPLPDHIANCPYGKIGQDCPLSPSEQVSVLGSLENIIFPTEGGNDTMAVLSTGRAVGASRPKNEEIVGTVSTPPQRFIDAHGGFFPSHPACVPKNQEHPAANDSMRLSVKMRTPTNANGFSFRFRFFSSEYPRFACAGYNDFFLAILDSKHPDIPKDGNISFDSHNNPISINNALFTTCAKQDCKRDNFHASVIFDGQCPASIPCEDNICGGKDSCPDGSADLLGYTSNTKDAGATAWLKTEAPVLPGEIITLDFIIFDAGGFIKDSLVLLDNFEWKIEPTQIRTVIN